LSWSSYLGNCLQLKREAFDDVVPILTNIAPAYEVIQVLMQIPTPRILFPDKPVVTLSGAAVDSGVIFNGVLL
jgi:hypothetical protein